MTDYTLNAGGRRARKMRIFVSVIAAVFFVMPLSSQAGAGPLRIWAMHNEPSEPFVDVTPEKLESALETLRREHGIVIENSARNLESPIESQHPLGIYIVGGNTFIDELIEFQRARGREDEIALEFVRWDDAYNRTVSALKSGDPESAPDVVQIGSTWTASFVDIGILTDVSEFFDRQDFFPPSAASAAPSGSRGLFAVPWFVDARLLFYNKDLVRNPETLATWEGFRSACEGRPPRRPLMGVPLSQNWNLLHNLAPWIWSAGGDIINPGRSGLLRARRVLLDSGQALEAVKHLNSLSSAGCLDFPNITQEVLDKRFVDGEYAAHIAGTWIISRMGDGWRRRFGVALPPAGPEGAHPFVGGSHLAITSAAVRRGNFDRSVALVAHFASPDVQRRYAAASNFLPAVREALDGFLDDGDGTFRRALEAGRSYPSISEWGAVVENEFIRSHLWHIWRDIAQGVPDETLAATVSNAASSLRSKLLLAQVKRAAPYAAGLAAAATAAAALAALLWRRRMREATRLCEEKSAELAQICAERSVLEAKALLLERRGERQSEQLASLKGELAVLGERAAELKAELARCAPKRAGDERRLGSLEIGWDGSLSICGERVRFDNNRQARRLIEHMLREARAGRSSAHCLSGYALFGWRANEIQSHPQRLFEIMVSKINAKLRALGAPPLIVKSGRKSFSWRIGWDLALVLARSDSARSASESDLALKEAASGGLDRACAHAITAVELDPKNLDALAVMRDALSGGRASEPYSSRMESMLKISEGMLGREIEELESGILSLEWMASAAKVPKGIGRDDFEEELAALRCAREHLSSRIACTFAARTGQRRPALFSDMMRRIEAAHADIVSLKAGGLPDEALWAQVAGSSSFSQLMAVPHLSSLVGNFYNDELNAKEDPRLVQLALISMLSREDALTELDSAGDERAVIAAVRRRLSREINSLSDSMESMS